MAGRSAAAWVAGIQGAYFALAGIWPLLHMSSFLWVTGPKHDLWLVQTVAVLVLAIGIALLVAWWRGGPSPEAALLGALAAAGLALVDVVFVATATIRPIYLLDALVEVALLASWGWAWRRTRRDVPRRARLPA